MAPLEIPSEQENQLWRFWRLIRKRLWMIVAIYVVIALTLSLDAMQKPRLYRATTQLLIEHENPKVISFEEAIGKQYVHDSNVPSSSYYQTQFKILQSRSLALRVIRALNLQYHPVFTEPEAPGFLQRLRALPRRLLTRGVNQVNGWIAPAPSPAVEPTARDAEKVLIGRFLQHLTIQPLAGTRLVNIHFTARTPHLAAEVVNTFAQIYVDQSLEMRFAASQESVDWLHRRVKDMRDQVEKADVALQQYKETHNIVSLEERQNTIASQMAALNQELLQTKTALISVEVLYQQMQKLQGRTGTLEFVPEIMKNARIQSLKQDRDAMIYMVTELKKRLKPQHPDILKHQQEADKLEEKINVEIQDIIKSIEFDYDNKKLHLRNIEKILDGYKKEAQELNKISTHYNVLNLDSKSNRDLYDILLESMKKTGISMELKRSNIRVIDAAEVSVDSVGATLISRFSLGSLLGLAVGLGLALLLESFDSSIKTPEEAQHMLQLPILCAVGQLKARDNTRDKTDGQQGVGLVSLQRPQSQAAEAFKTLCTNLLLGYIDAPRTVFLVTSPNPRDGKTTVAANLAISMAQIGRRVLLVDADLRYPTLHHLFGVGAETGLSALLLQADFKDLAAIEVLDGALHFIPAGPMPPNPLELISSDRMPRFIELARERYDIVVIDTPPILAVSDALMLSPHVDGIVAVLRCGATTRAHAKRTVEQLVELTSGPPMVDAQGEYVAHKVLGLAMNFLQRQQPSAYYAYGYNAYYRESADASPAAEPVAASHRNGHS